MNLFSHALAFFLPAFVWPLDFRFCCDSGTATGCLFVAFLSTMAFCLLAVAGDGWLAATIAADSANFFTLTLGSGCFEALAMKMVGCSMSAFSRAASRAALGLVLVSLLAPVKQGGGVTYQDSSMSARSLESLPLTLLLVAVANINGAIGGPISWEANKTLPNRPLASLSLVPDGEGLGAASEGVAEVEATGCSPPAAATERFLRKSTELDEEGHRTIFFFLGLLSLDEAKGLVANFGSWRWELSLAFLGACSAQSLERLAIELNKELDIAVAPRFFCCDFLGRIRKSKFKPS